MYENQLKDAWNFLQLNAVFCSVYTKAASAPTQKKKNELKYFLIDLHVTLSA